MCATNVESPFTLTQIPQAVEETVFGGSFYSQPVPVHDPARQLAVRLQNRVRELDISVFDLARRSGVSRTTVNRILVSKDFNFSFANLEAILDALGISIDFIEIPAEQFKHVIALQKTDRLISLTQGNVALESQAVSPTSAQAYLEAAKARIASTSRKLWAS